MKPEERFRARLTELGATLLDTHWRGTAYRYRIRCSEGHESAPFANSLIYHENAGICRRCSAKRNPATRANAARARQEFLDRLAKERVELLESEWLGSGKVHRIRCARGHETTIRPQALKKVEVNMSTNAVYTRRHVCVPCHRKPRQEGNRT